MVSVVELSKIMEFPDELLYGVSDTTYKIMSPLLDPFTEFANSNSVLGPQLDAVRQWVAPQMHSLAKRLPLMDPTPVLFSCLMYIGVLVTLFVVTRPFPKFTLKYFGMAHNFFLFALSLYMSVGIGITALACGYDLWNNAVGTDILAWRMAKLCWVFYVSKLPEFIDTFIMVLKHNYRQISFLHLFHHGSIFIFWYFVVSCGPGGDAYWSAMVNSGVHVIMYGYYFGTSIFSTGPIRKFLNGVKFYITYIQMTQFLMNAIQTIYLLHYIDRASLKYPAYLIQYLFWYMITLLALFGNFLIQNQGKKSAAADDGAAVSTAKSSSKKGR